MRVIVRHSSPIFGIGRFTQFTMLLLAFPVLLAVVGVCTGCDVEGTSPCWDAFNDNVNNANKEKRRKQKETMLCGAIDTLASCLGPILIGCTEHEIDTWIWQVEAYNKSYKCSATVVVPTSHTGSPAGNATRQAGITATPRAMVEWTTVSSGVATVWSSVATMASGVAPEGTTMTSGVADLMSAGEHVAVVGVSSGVMAVVMCHLS